MMDMGVLFVFLISENLKVHCHIRYVNLKHMISMIWLSNPNRGLPS